jgi:p-cumate 2,3-dioxygenase beta subunit
MSMAAITLVEASELVVREAALLDAWDTTAWSALFTEDGEYLVPSTDDPDGELGESLHLIHDDHIRLEQRAVRLLKRTAHAEYPHSRTTRIVSNVRLSEGEDGTARIDCTFVVYRSRRDRLDTYPGRAIYLVRRDGDGALRIRRKTAILGLEELRPQGKLSIIL